MAKQKAAKAGKGTHEGHQPKVIVLAERLGSFLGRVTNKVSKAKAKVALAKKSKAAAAPKRREREGEKSAAKSKGRSGGVVDAPGKRHRKPPPHELFDPRLGEPMGKQMGQKNLKRRGRE